MKTIDGLSNTLSEINLTSTQIENIIRDYNLSFPQLRDKKVEWEMKFPMFVYPFYDYLKNYSAVPDQNTYCNFYISQNHDFFSNIELSERQRSGLKARIYRTYPSLVRDVHFGLKIRESDFFDETFYNEVLDIEYGIDLVVFHSSKKLGLNLFTKTGAAMHARGVKQFRPKKKVDFQCLEVPIHFSKSFPCGQFFLYSETEFQQLKNIIRL